jgi:subtilisin family serine protease
MTDFSSRGPNDFPFGDIIKPDITAPGIQILAGASPTPDPGSVPNELFQAIAGTSMSSPHVAGILALIKQAHPDWSAARPNRPHDHASQKVR